MAKFAERLNVEGNQMRKGGRGRLMNIRAAVARRIGTKQTLTSWYNAAGPFMWNWWLFLESAVDGAVVAAVTEAVGGNPFNPWMIPGGAAGGAVVYILKWAKGEPA